MHTIGRLDVLVGKHLGHRLICQKHRFFYQIGRTGSPAHGNAGWTPFHIQEHTCFNGFKVNGSSFVTDLLALCPDLIKSLKHPDKSGLLGCISHYKRVLRHLSFKQIIYLLIRQASRRTDYGFHRLNGTNGTFRIKSHTDTYGQPIFMRAQRAQIIAKPLGQHRQDAIHKIHRAGSRSCLKID